MTTASATAALDQDNVEQTDVLVIGAGMAGLCAAIAARHAGASVIVLEKAPEAERGGNTRFSNGAIRAVYHGVEDIDALVGGLSASERERSEFGSYSREQYYDDLARVTQYRSHPDMADMLVENSRETLFWLQKLGAFGYKLIGVPSWAKLDPSTPRPTAEQLKNKTPTAALKTIPVAPKDVREAIGNVFAPQLKVSATGATFTAYYAALSKITKIEDIKGGILGSEVDFDSYDFSKIK